MRKGFLFCLLLVLLTQFLTVVLFADVPKYFTLGILYNIKQNYLITAVFKNSPAKEAGIEPGDYILEINGKPVKTLKLPDALQNEEEKEFLLKIKRKDEIKEFKISNNKIPITPKNLPEFANINIKPSLIKVIYGQELIFTDLKEFVEYSKKNKYYFMLFRGDKPYALAVFLSFEGKDDARFAKMKIINIDKGIKIEPGDLAYFWEMH